MTNCGASPPRCPGPSEVLICTAVSSEDEQPSSFLDYVAPLGPDQDRRGFTPVERPLTLRALVAELRQYAQLDAGAPEAAGSRRRAGCPGRRRAARPGRAPRELVGPGAAVHRGARGSAGRHRLRVAVEGGNRAEIAAGLVCPGRRRRGRHRLCPQPGNAGPRHRAGPAGCLRKRIRGRTRPPLARAGDEGQLGRQAGLPARRDHGPQARPVRAGDAQRGPVPGRRRAGLRSETPGRCGAGRRNSRTPTRRQRKRLAGPPGRAPRPGRPAGDRRRGPAGGRGPQDRQTPARQSRSGAASAAGRLPGGRAGRRLRRVPTTARRRCRAGPSWPSSAPPPRAPASRPRHRWTRQDNWALDMVGDAARVMSGSTFEARHDPSKGGHGGHGCRLPEVCPLCVRGKQVTE